MPLRKVFLTVVVTGLCATALVAIVALVGGGFGDLQARIILTTTALALYALCGMPAGLLLERRRARGLAFVDAALAAAAFVFALMGIWWSFDEGPPASVWKPWLVLSLFAAASAQTAALELRRRPDDPPSLRPLTLLAACAAYLEASLGSAAAIWRIDGSAFYRALGVVGVIDALLIVLIPVLRRGARRAVEPFRVAVWTDGAPPDEREVRARDFAAAAALAIREAEAAGRTVSRVERK